MVLIYGQSSTHNKITIWFVGLAVRICVVRSTNSALFGTVSSRESSVVRKEPGVRLAESVANSITKSLREGLKFNVFTKFRA